MKKIVSLVLLLMMLLSVATVGLVSVNAEGVNDDTQFILGDANNDGEVDITDATTIQRWVVKMTVKSFNEKAADVDGDGSVTSIDALQIQRWLAEFDVPYAIGEQPAAKRSVAAKKASEATILGDVNNDGKVDITDATTIQRFLAGMEVNNFNEKAADVDCDGEVTTIDATFIQRWLAEIEVPYAIGRDIKDIAEVGTAKDTILGDVDGDSYVTILDATAIQMYLSGLPVEGFNEAAADIDGDGEITPVDATIIQAWLSGLVSKYEKYAIGEKLGTQIVLLGDADGDGNVSIIDVTAIQRKLAHMRVKNFDEKAADVDGDGEVSTVDYIFIQRWLVEIKVPYEIGTYVPVYAEAA